MKKMRFLWIFLLGSVALHGVLYAQEAPGLEVEESAAVFLEDYSDTFQEQFFEGLKQKGIQNYDRAINAFLECKQLEPENSAVAHELAKAYLGDKKYQQALESALVAINTVPDNYWYLHTLYETLRAQGNTLDLVAERIPNENSSLQAHLADIYFKAQKYEEALAVLKGLKKDDLLQHLQDKVKDSLAARAPALITQGDGNKGNGPDPALSPVASLKMEMARLMDTSDRASLLERSGEAMDTYPLQPYFYYAHGYALNSMQRYGEAVELLETGLDYLINDVPLANDIYRELAKGYTGLSKLERANEYLSKIKPGF